VTGHAFWCDRTVHESTAVECTCAGPCARLVCRCGHTHQDHLGNGGFCRYCRPHHGVTTCLRYDPVRIPVDF
jgi:hypothetical protein